MFVDNEQKYHTMLYNNGDICFNSQKRFTYVSNYILCKYVNYNVNILK